jgi:FkbM family methyltransferase
MMWKKLISAVLPYGLVEGHRRARQVRDLGIPLRLTRWHLSGHLLQCARSTGLFMIPPGHLQGLKYVVDVGANTGKWSEMMLEIVSPVKLIAIEPEPQTFGKLKTRLEGRTGVDFLNVATGDHVGTVMFNVTRDTTGASVLPPKQEMRRLIGENWSVESKVECPLETLDRICSDLPEVSLLKIDVQGFERAVLAGATQTLGKTKFLLIELNYFRMYEGGSWFGEIHELLTMDGRFELLNVTDALVINKRATMSDGLYANRRLVEL